MSIKNRLQRMGDLGGTPVTPGPSAAKENDEGVATAPATSAVAAQNTPRTAPGQMLAFRGSMAAHNKRVEELEERLKAFEGSLPVRLLDPSKVRHSKWSNRHADSFTDSEYDSLKEAIASQGGNVQPVKVRPIQNLPDEYELIFGHRRHRACSELDLPLLALIDESVTDQELFVQMEMENRERKNLSVWEQGNMYQHALTEGLWRTQKDMAKALGLSQGNISSALLICALPKEVIEAFPSPNDVQFRWARALTECMRKDKGRLVKQAKELAHLEKKTAAGVFARLTSVDVPPIKKEEGRFSFVRRGKDLHISCSGVNLPASGEDALKDVLETFFASLKQ
jgi:ParB family chromosome partitioning protein